MQGLNNRDIFLLTHFVHGRRNHRKGVVNVNDVWFAIPENAPHIQLAIVGRNDPADQAEPLSDRQAIDLIVTSRVATYFVAMLLQQSAFLSYYNILPAWLLVIIVDDENVHAGGFDGTENGLANRRQLRRLVIKPRLIPS
jgi:hypothetical protein